MIKKIIKILIILLVLFLIVRLCSSSTFITVKDWFINLFKNFIKGIKVLKKRFS